MESLHPGDVAARMAPILRRRGVAKASLFGSVAAGTGGPSSDVDVLIECPRGFDLFDLADEKTQDAVIRRFEVMGEAARRLPDAFQEAHPAIPWRKIVGMRNVLAHEYDDIALEILWDTIENQLGALEESIRPLLESLG